MNTKNIIIIILVLCCISSITGGIIGMRAKQTGKIEGTEEFYVQKYELDKIKGILIDAIAAGTEIVPPLKTAADFREIEDYMDYMKVVAVEQKARDEKIARSQPHIDRIKGWCAKHKDAVEEFKKSETIRITYLTGKTLTAGQFYDAYMQDVSNAGKVLLFKVCAQQ